MTGHRGLKSLSSAPFHGGIPEEEEEGVGRSSGALQIKPRAGSYPPGDGGGG